MKPDVQKNAASFDDACRFLIKLGVAAHRYGSTATRLENFLSRATKALGFEGSFRVSPTEMIFAFDPTGAPQRIHMTTLPFGGLDFAKLALVGDLVDEVGKGTLSLDDASIRLDQIGNTPVPWGTLANALSYVGIGAGIAIIFSGSWWDVLFSALFSLVVYLMILFSGRFGKRTAEWIPLSTAFVVAVLTGITKYFIPELNLVIVVVSAIVVLLPGYGISLGIAELVGRQTVSGMANLMNGLVYLAKQFAGAWLGASLIKAIIPIAAAAPGTPVNQQWLWLFMPVVIIGLCICFQTSRRDFIAASLGCAIAYGGILLGSKLLDGNLGNLFGTIVAVVFANMWACKTKRPTSIVLIPAIVLLVSGSIGFRGLAALSMGQAATGEHQFAQMFIVALTIAAGVLIGNTISKSEVTL